MEHSNSIGKSIRLHSSAKSMTSAKLLLRGQACCGIGTSNASFREVLNHVYTEYNCTFPMTSTGLKGMRENVSVIKPG